MMRVGCRTLGLAPRGASASIRIMVFADRIEIVGPCRLPDGLSIEDLRRGVANRRNPILTGHATAPGTNKRPSPPA